MNLSIEIPDEIVDRFARRVVDMLNEQRPSSDERPEYLTVKSAAVFMDCREPRIRDLLTEGKLTRHKDGARTLINRVELEAYVAGEPTGPLALLRPRAA